MIKKNAKTDSDDFAFNWAFGLNGGYAFFLFINRISNGCTKKRLSI